ncbi:fasciclin domain-containing protein [Formosa sp. S-31]|uniref:fasciclin domain-containing protein n=1 Tax=Formosa sp. S-31 TaxID=2790949 RepID=UPI003EB9E25D
MKKGITFVLAIFALCFVAVSCDDDNDDDKNIDSPDMTIVEIALDTESLSSLVSALVLADMEDDSDLVGTLNGDGPFTVFAPTNQAFNNLLAELDDYSSLDDFDTPEGRVLLGTLLKYHVVAGASVMSYQLEDNQEITTVQGETLMVDLSSGVHIEDATDMSAAVTTADIEATNGVIHIVNKVLVPQEVIDALNEKTLVELVMENENLSILKDAVVKADLVDVLNGDGPFTVFAPTNDAFLQLLADLGEGYSSLDDFDTEEEMTLLTNVLLYHVLAAEVYASDLSEMSVETAFSGHNLNVVASGETYVIADETGAQANIVAADVKASNGVAHVIDKVLLPQ